MDTLRDIEIKNDHINNNSKSRSLMILNDNNIIKDQHGAGLIFPNRFKSIPLIFSTCFWLSENYHKIKETNSITKRTCDLAETTLKSSYENFATPLLSKFRNQVDFVDSVACNQLDKILAAFALISTDTTMIYSQTKQFIYDLRSQPRNQTRNLIGKMLDLSEKFVENNLIYNELIKQPNESNDQNKSDIFNYNERLVKSYKDQKDLFKDDLSYRTKILTQITYQSIQYKLLNQLNESFRLFKEYVLNLFKIIETFKSIKEHLALNVKDKFHVTKDKIDLYKEYLDVLSKQFMVQDGRSLDNVNSLEERTKIIIRRSIGNLLTAFYIIHARIKHMDPIIQQKFNTIRHFLLSLYHIYDKNDGSLINDAIVEGLMNESRECLNKIQLSINNSIRMMNNSTGNLDWLVPNFNVFGILNEETDDDENNENSGESETITITQRHHQSNGNLNHMHAINNQNANMLNELTHRGHRLI